MKAKTIGTANAWAPNLFLNPPPPWPVTGKLSDGTPIEIRKYRTSLLVTTDDGHSILVDCGPDFPHQLREFELGVVDAILITHSHLDHIGGLDELNLYRPSGPIPIPAYATKACWDSIRQQRGFGYVIDSLGLITENVLFQNPNSPSLQIGSITITPFQVEHHVIAPGAVGFLFEETIGNRTKRLLYTGDLWAVSNPNSCLFQSSIDLAIIECDRWSGLAGPAVGGGHMSFQEAVRMLSSGVLSIPPHGRYRLSILVTMARREQDRPIRIGATLHS